MNITAYCEEHETYHEVIEMVFSQDRVRITMMCHDFGYIDYTKDVEYELKEVA